MEGSDLAADPYQIPGPPIIIHVNSGMSAGKDGLNLTHTHKGQCLFNIHHIRV